jgi:uncharacterized protein
MRTSLLVTALVAATLGPPLAAQDIPARPDGWVTDRTGVLGPEAQTIGEELQAFRDSTGFVLGVVLLPTIGDHEPYEVATAIGRQWGIADTGQVGSQTKDLGATMLIVPKSAQSAKGRCFIASAKGSEGFLTDGRAAAICRDMIPFFKQGNYAAGIWHGVDAIESLTVDALAPAPPAPARASHRAAWVWWVLGGFVGIVGLGVVVAHAASRREEEEELRRAAAREQQRWRAANAVQPDPLPPVPPEPVDPTAASVLAAAALAEAERRRRRQQEEDDEEEERRRRSSSSSSDYGSGSSGSSDSGGGGFSFGGGFDSYSGGGGGSDW